MCLGNPAASQAAFQLFRNPLAGAPPWGAPRPLVRRKTSAERFHSPLGPCHLLAFQRRWTISQNSPVRTTVRPCPFLEFSPRRSSSRAFMLPRSDVLRNHVIGRSRAGQLPNAAPIRVKLIYLSSSRPVRNRHSGDSSSQDRQPSSAKTRSISLRRMPSACSAPACPPTARP